MPTPHATAAMMIAEIAMILLFTEPTAISISLDYLKCYRYKSYEIGLKRRFS
jgi:hypothetical protein